MVLSGNHPAEALWPHRKLVGFSSYEPWYFWSEMLYIKECPPLSYLFGLLCRMHCVVFVRSKFVFNTFRIAPAHRCFQTASSSWWMRPAAGGQLPGPARRQISISQALQPCALHYLSLYCFRVGDSINNTAVAHFVMCVVTVVA